jgi:phosphoribosylamine--glycine ligase
MALLDARRERRDMKTLIVGHGAREAVLGHALAQGSILHAFMGHANPSIVALTEAAGGFELGDVCDGPAVAGYAARKGIDMAMVSADAPLAAGVVDALLQGGIPTVGATQSAAEIEWSKVFSRTLLTDIDPAASPRHAFARSTVELEDAFTRFGSEPVVIKPSGLTGGKGVKVMGEHLASHHEALAYARALLRGGPGRGGVVIEEKLTGPEFTIQAVSDGETVICPPATYDYPYRYEGDAGPGTGGMGSFSVPEDALPFISQDEYDRACEIIRRVIHGLAERGRRFSGVMNSGFFATPDGVRVTEFNARFGDPECMNIMQLFAGSWVDTMRAISEQRLTVADLPLRRDATAVVYLVSPDYALRPGGQYEFELDREAIERAGCGVFFAACTLAGPNRYRTVGTSRAVALTAGAPSLREARDRVQECIQRHVQGPLQWRRDIAADDYIASLQHTRSSLLEAPSA